MILIYSKDVDDFVNQVIDCLDEDFIRFSESDKIKIGEMNFSNLNSSYIFKNDYFDCINLECVKSIWFNGGGTADIVTEDLRLIERLLYQFRDVFRR
ncbi:hypothetical protein [Flavobacterium sp. SM2513]|uniref:hypothetical protein n=1 Tax=Flavobacterium sp. SM2513 TaxID=3424766 RepID=UPI003D7F35B4